MQKFEFSYDKENDNLFLFNLASKSRGGVELGDLILDYDSKKQLVGIQIMHASSLIQDLITENIQTIRDVLCNLIECGVETRVKGNLMITKIFLNSNIRNISAILPVPNIQETSPALAYA
jgi:uncharacterized protein YuzE